MNNGPKRFIECLLPVTACNLKCEYCYIIQEERRTNTIPSLKYSPEHICNALSKERLGGPCYISICGAGETLIPSYVVNIVHGLLKEGHYVNLTTNGTLANRFKELVNVDKSILKHLHIAFSFHFLELKSKGLLSVFFDNVNVVKQAGCSFLIQINLYDGYIPHLNEIKRICLEKTGAYPQVAATRDESNGNIRIHTSLSVEEYTKLGNSFQSPLFDFTMKNFNVKRNEFCYAGDWSFLLNLETGIMTKCYSNREGAQNIFEDITKPIVFEAIGCNCKHRFCVNSSHFISLGVIPSISSPTYSELRNRKEAKWYTKEMEEFLSEKLINSNGEYSYSQKRKINNKYKKTKCKNCAKLYVRKAKNFIKLFLFLFRYYRLSRKSCYFIPQHEHTNIGDAAIALSQLEIIKKIGLKPIEIRQKDFERYKTFIIKFLNSPRRIFFFEGGGNMGNVWFGEEQYRRSAINALSKVNVVIFPQTIFYSKEFPHNIEGSISTYNNRRVTLFLRENYSYEIAKEKYKSASSFLVPDTVLLSHSYVDKGTHTREGVLLVMRGDLEKLTKEDDVNYIKKVLKENMILFAETDMHADISLTPSNRLRYVKEKINQFKKHKIVITDRLHGMIFAAITNTPCIVFENANYKIKGCYEWIKDFKNIKVLKDICEFKDCFFELFNNDLRFNNNLDTTQYIQIFEKLKKKLCR